MFLLFFFFKQKTAYEMRISDWSSDVCSSDLDQRDPHRHVRRPPPRPTVPTRRPRTEAGQAADTPPRLTHTRPGRRRPHRPRTRRTGPGTGADRSGPGPRRPPRRHTRITHTTPKRTALASRGTTTPTTPTQLAINLH